MNEEKVLKFAKEFGFVSVVKENHTWKDYDEVWTPSFSEKGKPCFYGEIRFIFVKGDKLEMSSIAEGSECCHFLDNIDIQS